MCVDVQETVCRDSLQHNVCNVVYEEKCSPQYSSPSPHCPHKSCSLVLEHKCNFQYEPICHKGKSGIIVYRFLYDTIATLVCRIVRNNVCNVFVCQEWRRCVRRSARPCAEWWRTGSARRSTCSATSRPARRTSSRVSRRSRSVGMRTGPSATLTTTLSRSGPVSLFVSWSFCPSASLLYFFQGGSLLHGP